MRFSITETSEIVRKMGGGLIFNPNFKGGGDVLDGKCNLEGNSWQSSPVMVLQDVPLCHHCEVLMLKPVFGGC